MSFYFIRPEEAGFFGDLSSVDRSGGNPVVTCRDFEYDCPPQDAVVYCPWGIICVTKPLLEALDAAKLTGFIAHGIVVGPSSELSDLDPTLSENLPPLFWLQLLGVPHKDDFARAGLDDVVVSQAALDCFCRFPSENLQVKPTDEGPID